MLFQQRLCDRPLSAVAPAPRLVRPTKLIRGYRLFIVSGYLVACATAKLAGNIDPGSAITAFTAAGAALYGLGEIMYADQRKKLRHGVIVRGRITAMFDRENQGRRYREVHVNFPRDEMKDGHVWFDVYTSESLAVDDAVMLVHDPKRPSEATPLRYLNLAEVHVPVGVDR
jgi:hypothetical protein